MIDKKALITTFHCCPNYGAVLQAYGLQEYLASLFSDVQILDYRPLSLVGQYKYINTYSLASILMSLWSLPSFYRKKRAFKRFEKNLHITTESFDHKVDITQQAFDYCFLGSDQIWNPEITDGFDSVYFGDVPFPIGVKKIAYAASIGKSFFTEEETVQFKALTARIDEISMREEEAKDLVKKVTGRTAAVVVDPTILSGCDCFKKFIHKVRYSHYIFVYTLRSDSGAIEVANQIATSKGLQIVQVSGVRKGLHFPKHKVIYDAGVEDFLSLIYHADYVVTDSFHGTAFSILFHKGFITIPHKTRGGRMVSLLSKAGLLSRLSHQLTDELLRETIDWFDVDKRIDQVREESKNFLKSAIYDCEA